MVEALLRTAEARFVIMPYHDTLLAMTRSHEASDRERRR
jgi:hypothetical protein